MRTVCVCLCVQASHPLLTQLQDQVDIPMDSVSCSLQNNLVFLLSFEDSYSAPILANAYIISIQGRVKIRGNEWVNERDVEQFYSS